VAQVDGADACQLTDVAASLFLALVRCLAEKGCCLFAVASSGTQALAHALAVAVGHVCAPPGSARSRSVAAKGATPLSSGKGGEEVGCKAVIRLWCVV
jgi:hypothetical protein